MNKIEISASEFELLRCAISRAKIMIGLLWISSGAEVSPELQGDALESAHADCSSAVAILSKFDG
jgi:hypothetical protein